MNSRVVHFQFVAADADRPDPDKRISPTEEFLTQRLGAPRTVAVKDERER